MAHLECSRAMQRVGLFNKLAVHVRRQRSTHGAIRPLKTKASEAWVSCFNEAAARQLVDLAKKFEQERQEEGTTTWFPQSYSWYVRKWGSEGISGMTIKDLRRASLYWLGHHTEMYPMELMKHARHSQIKTTLLYLRRPEERVEPGDDPLDLDT